MSTPICDFVNKYIASSPVRMHMPGHKGKAMLGFEPYDLTEIDGADDLMAPDGIIAQSEAEASRLFCTFAAYLRRNAAKSPLYWPDATRTRHS